MIHQEAEKTFTVRKSLKGVHQYSSSEGISEQLLFATYTAVNCKLHINMLLYS